VICGSPLQFPHLILIIATCPSLLDIYIDNKQRKKVKLKALISEGKSSKEDLKVTLGYINWNGGLNIVSPVSKIIKTWGEERSMLSLYV
jgi:hypothetical protein